MEALTGKQRRHLRGLGHHLQPMVMIGKEGVSPTVVQSADEALSAHELIKIKIQEGCGQDRHQAAKDLAQATGSEVAQVLGRTILLYRRNMEKQRIELP